MTRVASAADHREVVTQSKRKRFAWLHLCNGLDPKRDGGMVPSILGMTGAIAEQGGPVSIVTGTPSRLRDVALPEGLGLFGPEIPIENAVRSAEVVHMHGLWQRQTRRGAAVARAAGVPYMIAAHGMAEPWALRHKALKKKLYTAFIEGKNLRRATCLHALSRPEIEHLRRLAPNTPAAFIPNGVDLRPFDRLPDRSELERDYPEIVGSFLLLFYGRIHVKKGLDLLAEALGALTPARPNVRLLLAGNDDGALAPFLQSMESLGLRSRVTVLGHVSGERARKVWGAADAFVLPSYSEGFSMSILEALACRLPVLITEPCHFPELSAAGGGITVKADRTGVTEGLAELLDLDDSDRRRLGERGRALVEREYTWGRQAEKLAAVYDWMSGGGAAPDCVIKPGSTF